MEKYMCPQCKSEDFGGNGDNTNDCFKCGYHFHDTEILITKINYDILKDKEEL